jgi:uncharacterized membrane protein YcaP (DUF421 family)
MKFLNDVWGIKENIGPLEITARAVVMFLITLIIIRISGMRAINKSTPFEAVITILIGGILSRGVIGATPFFSAVFGSIAIIIIQKLLSRLSFYNSWIDKASKGEAVLLYKDGKFLEENMKKSDVTAKEIYEDLRLKCQLNTLDNIEEIFMEKKGEISFIRKSA